MCIPSKCFDEFDGKTMGSKVLWDPSSSSFPVDESIIDRTAEFRLIDLLIVANNVLLV